MRAGAAILVFLCSLAGPAREARASPHPLSLREAVLYALERAPGYDSLRRSEAVSQLQYKTAWAKLLPSLDFSTTLGLQNDIGISTTAGTVDLATNTTSPAYSSLSLGLTENLYDNGVSLTNLSIAELNRRIAALNTLKGRDSLALSVATEFHNYSLVRVLLEVRQRQQEVLDRQFRTLTDQFLQGFKPKSDYLRIKTQVQRAEIDRIDAENAVALSAGNLTKLLGVSVDAPPEQRPAFLAETAPAPASHEAELEFPDKKPALDAFYDSRVAKLQDEVSERGVRLVRRNYLPQATLTAGVTYQNQSFINTSLPFDAGQQFSYDLLLTLQYNLWDWGSRRHDVEVAELNRDIQKDSLDAGLQDLDSKLASLMAELGRDRRAYGLSRELIGLEEESYRNVEGQYREGKVTYLDLITSLTNLLSARIQYYTAYFGALTSRAQYRYYEGTLYEELVGK